MNAIDTITFAPAIINVEGKTATERKLSVFNNATESAQLALVSAGGKVGKAATQQAARTGLAHLCAHAANSNFKPLAEYLAGMTGKPMVISNRTSFLALPDLFEASIMAAKAKKSGGFVTDKKTGALKPNAELALAMNLKAICVDTIAAVESIQAKRAAERQAKIAA
jgi:hypothetical protein